MDQELGLIWTIPQALEAFYRDLLWALEDLVDHGGTAEGAARVAKDVAVRHGVPGADRAPLPRPSRKTRRLLAEEARLKSLDQMADA